jgi:gamma-glutamyltranspeptidase/glutathione hydrolase
VRHDGSAEPTGQPEAPHGGTVLLEPTASKVLIAELERRGHTVSLARGVGFGGYQGILIDWETGVLHGATEPRKDGCAAGY